MYPQLHENVSVPVRISTNNKEPNKPLAAYKRKIKRKEEYKRCLSSGAMEMQKSSADKK